MPRFRFVIAIAAGVLTATAGVAAEIDVPPPIKPKSHAVTVPNAVTAPKNTSVYVNQPNCMRWTDECVNCTRGVDGKPPTCSNIGFACQPKDIRCIGDLPNKPETK